MMNTLEIEQKFECKGLPDDLSQSRKSNLERTYLCLSPEVRLNRRIFENGTERFHLTVKSTGYLKRSEIKIAVTKEQYEAAALLAGTEPLRFEIYEYQLDETHTICVKKCMNFNNICFAEIEYSDMDDYEAFGETVAGLSWLGREVTFEESYYVRNIWKRYKDGDAR